MVTDPKTWLKSYSPGMPSTLDYPRAPLYHFLQESTARYPERAAIIYQDSSEGNEPVTKTYLSLDEDSSRFAAALVSLGVRKGDRVAYYIQNSPELITGFYGILKAGAVPVPCNVMYRAEELAYHLNDSGAKVLFCEAELYPTAQQVLAETPVSNVIVAGGNVDGQAISWDSLLTSVSPLTDLPALDVDEDLALLPYTGGTTGIPKGAMLTHANMVANAVQFRDWFGYEPGGEVFVATLPLFHIGGIAGVMSVPLSAGGTIVLFRRFSAERVLKAIQDYRATRFLGVPTMYIALLNHENASKYDLSSLRASRTSAAPLPKAVKESFDSLVGHEVLVEGYGLTETSPLTHANPVNDARAGSIGVPLPDTDALVFDADDGVDEMPLGEVGELALRGPQVMKGYWKRPLETSEAIRNGWFYTGDLAYMDERGYFFIVDRKKDVINAAGFKVWPREVEEVLYQHPSVRLAAVLGVPDDYRGETVKAVIALREAHEFKTEESARKHILAHCQHHLASYKIPRIVEFRDELPLSAAGKVLRRVMREEAIEAE
ncbi:Long-chain-fatty-acid--CoA ligase [Geodia barretti]|uniref:Long-chain-fatty-acid--CoA ligase n=1 Tax=Geodia barretti TaxID=519541 RepID=A0AA35WZN8_GEOBA|nr:Long-chain-fatty-acid--CoA ligase [Geodia barretti]